MIAEPICCELDRLLFVSLAFFVAVPEIYLIEISPPPLNQINDFTDMFIKLALYSYNVPTNYWAAGWIKQLAVVEEITTPTFLSPALRWRCSW